MGLNSLALDLDDEEEFDLTKKQEEDRFPQALTNKQLKAKLEAAVWRNTSKAPHRVFLFGPC